MTILDTNTVVIETSAELKNVLENENTYTYIYLGQNITLTSGIMIHRTKTNITIDGTYNGIRYTYTDMKSSGSGDTISVRNKNNQQVTIKNMNIMGNNYYGVVYVPEDNALQDIVITFDAIVYNGPQITFHPTGLSRYLNADITITNTYLTAGEVAECNRIEMGGTTTITHTATSNSSFWFRGPKQPSFTILRNSTVTMTSTYRELFYGVTNLLFSIMEGATFSLTSKYGMGYGSYATGNVLIDKQATFTIHQTGLQGAYPTWYCTGAFVMNEGSSLFILNHYPNITTSNYNLYFQTTAASFTLNNPKTIVLYNSKAPVLYSNASIPFHFEFIRLNMWKQSKPFEEAGSLDDLPAFAWYKDQETAIIEGTFTPTSTTISSHTFTTEELKALPPLTSFILGNCQVISIGTLPLSICSIEENATNISGYTEKNADVQISYLTNQTIVTANQDGFFESNNSSPLPIGTQITFIANVKNSFLYQTKVVQIVYMGELTLTEATQTIQFLMQPFSSTPILCSRSSDLQITVTDSRIQSTDWQLYAAINQPLTSENGFVLTDSLVYKNSTNITPLMKTPLLVYQGQKNDGATKITNVTFAEQEGILLRIANEAIENGERYETTIIWSLKE